jgi:putative acetyltransferase
MHIRQFQPGEEPQLWALFYHTIHQVNIQDYTEIQINAWAPKQVDMQSWIIKTQARSPFVALINQQIVGYSDLQPNGYIDHFFCHHEFQGKGVGRALMQHIEQLAKRENIDKLTADVSLTANPFFAHMGFEVVNNQQLSIRGQLLNNFKMQKNL